MTSLEGIDDRRNELAKHVIDAGHELLALQPERFSLEDAFLHLTREA